jgi:hypothetical protein
LPRSELDLVLKHRGLLGTLDSRRLKKPPTPEISVVVKGDHPCGQNETFFEDFHRPSSWVALCSGLGPRTNLYFRGIAP